MKAELYEKNKKIREYYEYHGDKVLSIKHLDGFTARVRLASDVSTLVFQDSDGDWSEFSSCETERESEMMLDYKRDKFE